MQLPTDFVERTGILLGKEWDAFYQSLQEEAPTSIRTNKLKYASDLSYEKVQWCDNGYYLDKRPQFTFDPLFHAGCYYVQEASSMFVEQALKQYADGDVRFLDLCAAPGGKSTLVSGLLSENSLLMSNEVIRSRANILSENITKWGNANTVVTNNDPATIGKLKHFFDVILVDAPCSGEGMFRKDEGAVSEWSVGNVKLCKERQQRILADIWSALKPGGLLIYSTCTYNREENEDNVKWVRDELGADILPVEIREEWGISPSYDEDIHAYHFFPHKVKGEGFFISVLRKHEDESVSISAKKRKDKEKRNKVELSSDIKGYITDQDVFAFYPKNDKWYAFPKNLQDELSVLKEHLNIVSEGICLGEFKGKDFIPDQSLALSNNLNKDAFTTCKIDWRTAVNYLRREPIVLENQPKGYILLTYRDIPLGFVKNIGNRANNLYPNEWRIRSANIPDEVVKVV